MTPLAIAFIDGLFVGAFVSLYIAWTLIVFKPYKADDRSGRVTIFMLAVVVVWFVWSVTVHR